MSYKSNNSVIDNNCMLIQSHFNDKGSKINYKLLIHIKCINKSVIDNNCILIQ